MLLVCCAYLALLTTLYLTERARTRASSPDLFTCFIGLFALQAVIPPAVVIGIRAFDPSTISIQRVFFERVFNDIDSGTAMQVLLLTSIFVAFLYLAFIAVCGPGTDRKIYRSKSDWYVSLPAWMAIASAGVILNVLLLSMLGGGLESYVNLIRFRAGDPSIVRTGITANLFSLTQTFSLFAIIGVVAFLKKGNRQGLLFAVACAVFFALMTASRRALFVQLILIYFVIALEHRQLFLTKWILPSVVFALPVIMYGKQILAYVAFDTRIDFADLGIGSFVRAAMDIGITTVESWATIMYLHEPYRFGVDHFLSAARRIPEGILALNIQFPERIVRTSTEVFVGKYDADLPPGFFGQMWLDWGYAGPAIWGITFGLQLGILQKAYEAVRPSHGLTAIFVLALFIVSLPLNTGSFDFTFSVDIFALVLLLLIVLRAKPGQPMRD